MTDFRNKKNLSTQRNPPDNNEIIDGIYRMKQPTDQEKNPTHQKQKQLMNISTL